MKLAAVDNRSESKMDGCIEHRIPCGVVVGLGLVAVLAGMGMLIHAHRWGAGAGGVNQALRAKAFMVMFGGGAAAAMYSVTCKRFLPAIA